MNTEEYNRSKPKHGQNMCKEAVNLFNHFWLLALQPENYTFGFWDENLYLKGCDTLEYICLFS